MNKTGIYLGAAIGGVVCGYLGGLLDHGNMFGLWSIFFALVGALGGVFAAYKIQQSLL